MINTGVAVGGYHDGYTVRALKESSRWIVTLRQPLAVPKTIKFVEHVEKPTFEIEDYVIHVIDGIGFWAPAGVKLGEAIQKLLERYTTQ